jgi:hypothetical protein
VAVPDPFPPVRRTPWGLACGLSLAIITLGVSLTWIDRCMRGILAIGGACTTGGPGVSDQPCPSGSGLIVVAIPLVLMAGIGGSAAARALRAPNLPVVMLAALLTMLAVNFFDFAFSDGVNLTNLVGGVLTAAFAAPFLAMLVTARGHPLRRSDPPVWPRPLWVLGYAVLSALGVAIGWAVFQWVIS